MKKIYMKLVLITVTLILSVSVVAMSSYAWLVLSDSPAVSGIQVTMGGGNTILIAPDVETLADGTVYHYPGTFTDKINFGLNEHYSYLKDLAGLNPVSTADGVHWFLPAYYDSHDEAVQMGDVLNGALRDVGDFQLDNQLAYANLTKSDDEKVEEGHYIYLDFWVVSPGSDYTLRLSTPTAEGDLSGGSFVVDLMQPVRNGDRTYTLQEPEHKAAGAVRVGFLANLNRVTDNTMLYYQQSPSFDPRYTQLQGLYQEGSDAPYQLNNRFTIYEPNGDSHPTGIVEDGRYVTTNPIAWVDGSIREVSVSDRVTVQKTSRWMSNADGTGTAIEQIFQTTLMGLKQRGQNVESLNPKEVLSRFYGAEGLQGQISNYVEKGAFIQRTSDLYKFSNGLSAEQLSQLNSGGATDDVYIIKLERNVPQRIRMFIWLEGQDVDCVDNVRSSNFAVNIEFAGGTK